MSLSLKNKSFLSHLECSQCGLKHDAPKVQTVCTSCGKVLLARYGLRQLKSHLSKNELSSRPATLWRYRELLPVQDESNIISLGEGMTPIIKLSSLGKTLGVDNLWMKDEGLNPTGSFKARGMSVAVSKAKEFGITELATPSAGNAGGALAAYAARAKMNAHIFLPVETPRANIEEARSYGAETLLVEGSIADAAKAMNERNTDRKWFDCSTMKEPYRLEGKKTMGFEIAEQFGWTLPDIILYPTGGGTGLIGMWKAFAEMEELGWIGSKRPRMIAVQSSGCAPIVQAFDRHESGSTFWKDAHTIASGLRVPKAFADYLILKTLSDSGGTALAVEDAQIINDVSLLARAEGIYVCPEGAATVSALRTLITKKWVSRDERILLLNTGSGYKYDLDFGKKGSVSI